jgi:hypothetical protein
LGVAGDGSIPTFTDIGRPENNLKEKISIKEYLFSNHEIATQ